MGKRPNKLVFDSFFFHHFSPGGAGALGSIKNRKTALKITQNRKTAIDFDQNRKPHTKPSKPKIYTAQFSPNPSLDLKRW